MCGCTVSELAAWTFVARGIEETWRCGERVGGRLERWVGGEGCNVAESHVVVDLRAVSSQAARDEWSTGQVPLVGGEGAGGEGSPVVLMEEESFIEPLILCGVVLGVDCFKFSGD